MASTASAIRKAAILVSALDTRSADRILDQMGEQIAAQVRSAVMSLGEVPTEIQQAVVREFFEAQGREAPLAPAKPERSAATQDQVSVGVELVLSSRTRDGQGAMRDSDLSPSEEAGSAPRLHRRDAAREIPNPLPATGDSQSPPFEFLAKTSVETLASYLQREHVQTIAVVIDQLPPDRSAAVLSHFAPLLQSQVIRRLAALTDTDPEVLQAIAAALESNIGPLPKQQVKTEPRVESLRLVINRLDGDQRRKLLHKIGESDFDLATRLGGALQEELRAESFGESHPSLPLPSAGPSRNSPDYVTGPLVDFAMASDAVFATVLREAPAHWVLLALADADPALLGRLHKTIPAKQWRGLQQRLRELGPYRLSDIAAAKRGLAEIAGRLAKPADRKAVSHDKIAA